MLKLKRKENGEIKFSEAKWTHGGKIKCVVETECGRVLPYCASKDDDVAHGVELFELISEKYSEEIAPYTDEERLKFESEVQEDPVSVLEAENKALKERLAAIEKALGL